MNKTQLQKRAERLKKSNKQNQVFHTFVIERLGRALSYSKDWGDQPRRSQALKVLDPHSKYTRSMNIINSFIVGRGNPNVFRYFLSVVSYVIIHFSVQCFNKCLLDILHLGRKIQTCELERLSIDFLGFVSCFL